MGTLGAAGTGRALVTLWPDWTPLTPVTTVTPVTPVRHPPRLRERLVSPPRTLPLLPVLQVPPAPHRRQASLKKGQAATLSPTATPAPSR